MGTISGCRYLKVNLKAKIYIFVNSTIQMCPSKNIKIFLIEDFFICHRCQQHRWSTLSCEYHREFSKKFETALMVYSGAWGTLIHEKTRSRKSRGTVPLSSLQNNTWNGSASICWERGMSQNFRKEKTTFGIVFLIFSLKKGIFCDCLPSLWDRCEQNHQVSALL